MLARAGRDGGEGGHPDPYNVVVAESHLRIIVQKHAKTYTRKAKDMHTHAHTSKDTHKARTHTLTHARALRARLVPKTLCRVQAS